MTVRFLDSEAPLSDRFAQQALGRVRGPIRRISICLYRLRQRREGVKDKPSYSSFQLSTNSSNNRAANWPLEFNRTMWSPWISALDATKSSALA